FKQSDPNFDQVRQQFTSSYPCALPGERADVHFINNLKLDPHAGPPPVSPAISKWIDDLRSAMRTFGLKTGCGIGTELFTPIQTEAITHAGARRLDDRREVSVAFRL